jgi:transketolase
MVCETLTREQVSAPVLPVAFRERWFRPAMLPDVLRVEQLEGEQIADRILERLRRSKAA